MNLHGFKFQNVRITCDYPESPLFWEATPHIINSNLHLYTRWRRTNAGFFLEDIPKKSNIYLYTDGLRADIDEPTSVDNPTLTSTIEIFKTQILSTITKYGYESVTNAEYSYRFYKQFDNSIPNQISTCSRNFISDFRKFITNKENDVADFGLNIFVPYGDFWVGISVYSLYKEEILNLFETTGNECGEEGLGITVIFKNPTNKNLLSLDGLKNLLSIPPDEFFNIAEKVIGEIPD
jgi:hypothetical protein